jgi:hypothetical protein
MQIEIWIKGQIDNKWSDWLDGLMITPTDEGLSVLSGHITDQSALYGLLSRLSNLGFQLISVVSENANNSDKEA